MIWWKLSFFLLVASLCDSGSLPDSYVVYGLDSGSSVDFYMADLNLNTPKKVASLSKQKTDPTNMVLSRDGFGLNLYWSYKNSPLIGRYQFTKNIVETKTLGEDNSVFIGIGFLENIYFYSESSKVISIYDFDSGVRLQQINNFQNSDAATVHGVAVDPLNRDKMFFAECLGNTFTGRVYNITGKSKLWNYTQSLPKCFNIWRITPNGERVFAVHGNEIYTAATEDAPFIKYRTTKDPIVGFSVENDVLFYSTKENKIFRMPTNCFNIVQTHIDVEGLVKVIAVYTPKRYLVYATENQTVITFYRTNFDLCSPSYHFHALKHLKVKTLDRIFFGFNESQEMLFWTYISDNENFVKSYNTLRRTFRMTPYSGNKYKFVGIGYNDTMYHFASDSKVFQASSSIEAIHVQMRVEKITSSDMSCIDVNPLNREQLFFLECNKNGALKKVLDVKEKKIFDANQSLPVCFETWRITPNGKKVYGVFQNTIYISPEEGAPFVNYTYVDKEIKAFTVGNNELFYTTSEFGKIFKLTQDKNDGRFFTSELNVNDNIKSLVVYEE